MSSGPRPVSIALQLSSVRDELTRDPDSTLGAIADIGFDAVEWFGGLGDRSSVEWRRALDRAGLNVIGAHLPLTELEGDAGAGLDRWQTLGCHLLVCSAPEPDRVRPSEEWEALGRRLDLLGYPLHAAGFGLAYHPHAVEFTDGSSRGLEAIRAQWSLASISIEPDVFWLAWSGRDAAAEMRRLADSPGRIRAVHLKDAELPPASSRPGMPYTDIAFRPLGEGDLDLETALEAIIELGIETLVVEQDFPHRSPLEDAARSFDWLTDRIER